ncbi:MAG: glucoamylase family protein [Bacteroidales bacterium]
MPGPAVKILYIPIILILLGFQISSLRGQDTILKTHGLTVLNRQQLLDDVHYRSFNYFLQLSDSITGLVPQRFPENSCSDIAATGFGLTALIVGVENSYITRDEAVARVLKVLKLIGSLPASSKTNSSGSYKGFFYEQLDMRTGLRCEDAQISTLAQAILMGGVLCCMTYFDKEDPGEQEIRKLADKLYRQVNWKWMLNKHETPCKGWAPEIGFHADHWYGYNESMLIMILALGSPTHRIPQNSWKAWTSNYNWGMFEGLEYLNCMPLSGHQYSHAFIDFRGIKDNFMKQRGIDYFENSRRATMAQRNYCISNPSRFRDYSSDTWGLTTCEGPRSGKRPWRVSEELFKGHTTRGVASDLIVDDGTIAPAGAGGSIPFLPEECLSALENMYKKYGSSLYGEFGFRNAFNPTFRSGNEHTEGWFSKNNYGVDEGLILLMLENYKTGLIWNIMKKNPYIIEGLINAGFRGGWLRNARN